MRSSPRQRAPRIRIAFVLSVLAAGAVYLLVHLGQFMAAEDRLQRADVIFVLAGTLAERPLEAADLYRSGYAPRVVVTRAVTEQATFQLESRGIRIPMEHDLNRDVLLQAGVPAAALISPSFIHDNTAEEARTLAELTAEHRWRRVIIVTSRYHLRRSKLAIRRALRGTGTEIIMRGSRYDPSVPDRWWTRRPDVRWLAAEVPKLVAYAIGLG